MQCSGIREGFLQQLIHMGGAGTTTFACSAQRAVVAINSHVTCRLSLYRERRHDREAPREDFSDFITFQVAAGRKRALR